MARPPGRKLKVFQAQFGFFDSVVAAPSQAAALRAWGAHQDLFKSGQARPATDEAAIDAARQHPLTPLRRPVGSQDRFELDPKGLPQLPEASKGPRLVKTGPPKPAPAAPAKPPPDRSRLDAAETALRELDARRKREDAADRAALEALRGRMAKAQAAYVADRKAATSALVEARKAYRDAGGEGV